MPHRPKRKHRKSKLKCDAPIDTGSCSETKREVSADNTSTETNAQQDIEITRANYHKHGMSIFDFLRREWIRNNHPLYIAHCLATDARLKGPSLIPGKWYVIPESKDGAWQRHLDSSSGAGFYSYDFYRDPPKPGVPFRFMESLTYRAGEDGGNMRYQTRDASYRTFSCYPVDLVGAMEFDALGQP